MIKNVFIGLAVILHQSITSPWSYLADGAVVKDNLDMFRIQTLFFFTGSMIFFSSTVAWGAMLNLPAAVSLSNFFFFLFRRSRKLVFQVVFEKKVRVLNSYHLTQKSKDRRHSCPPSSDQLVFVRSFEHMSRFIDVRSCHKKRARKFASYVLNHMKVTW